jgi:hypothetical protein
VLQKGPDAQIEVNGCCSDPTNLSRSGSDLHHGEDEVAEGLVLDRTQDLHTFLGRPNAIAMSGRRFLDRLDGIGLQDPFDVNPVESTLDGDDGIATAPLPTRMGVKPAGNMEGFEIPPEQGPVQFAEVLEICAIPPICPDVVRGVGLEWRMVVRLWLSLRRRSLVGADGGEKQAAIDGDS